MKHHENHASSTGRRRQRRFPIVCRIQSGLPPPPPFPALVPLPTPPSPLLHRSLCKPTTMNSASSTACVSAFTTIFTNEHGLSPRIFCICLIHHMPAASVCHAPGSSTQRPPPPLLLPFQSHCLVPALPHPFHRVQAYCFSMHQSLPVVRTCPVVRRVHVRTSSRLCSLRPRRLYSLQQLRQLECISAMLYTTRCACVLCRGCIAA
jgi:hypothetical protein